MNKFWAFLLLGMLAIAFVSQVQAQTADDADADEHEQRKSADDEEDEDEEDLLYIPHPDVQVSYAFPDSPNRKLKLGENANILLGFYNKADQAFNITGIGAHLQSPFDLSYYIQNFTARRVVGAPVGPGQQGAVEYQFRPDPALEPVEYWMTAWVIYNNSNDQVYMHTFYNGTVELEEESSAFGFKQALYTLLTLGGLAGAAYFFVRSSAPGSSKSSKRVERGTRDGSDGIQFYTPAKESRVVKRKTITTTKKTTKTVKKQAGNASGTDSAESAEE